MALSVLVGPFKLSVALFLTNLSLPSLPNLTLSDIFLYPLNVNINFRKIRIALGLIIDSLYENAMLNKKVICLIKFYKVGGVWGACSLTFWCDEIYFWSISIKSLLWNRNSTFLNKVKTQMMAQNITVGFDIVTTHFMSISIPLLKLPLVKILCLACICKQLVTAIQSSKLSVSNIIDNE